MRQDLLSSICPIGICPWKEPAPVIEACIGLGRAFSQMLQNPEVRHCDFPARKPIWENESTVSFSSFFPLARCEGSACLAEALPPLPHLHCFCQKGRRNRSSRSGAAPYIHSTPGWEE